MRRRRTQNRPAQRRSRDDGQSAGIAPGERFTGTVRDVTAEGSGVVEHASGRVFFVPGVWPGERGVFRVTALRGRFGHAALDTLEHASAQRVEPRCPHHGSGPSDCGGCPWQFVDYAAQCTAKSTRVRAAMAALGAEAQVRDLWPAPQAYGYRNRAQLKTDGERLGYVAAASNALAPIADCPILTPHNRDTLRGLLARLPEPGWRPARRQPWTSLDIDETVTAQAVSADRRLPFRQGNSAQNTRMRTWLAEQLTELPSDTQVVELFCGDGNFTEVLAARGFSHVTAIDSAGDAIGRLAARDLPGVEALTGDLYAESAWDCLRGPLRRAQLLVLDPPRAGLKNAAGLLKRARALQRVIYISCDLATFHRDVGEFQAAGFRVESVQPLDQFPHTPHIELLGSMRRA
jgi:23S rRNA (uracil1939-C5)-methyltransferase